MKRIVQTAVVGVLLAAAQSAFAFPVAAETNVGQGALSTYAEQHERAGTLMVGSGSSLFPKGEQIARAALDTYAAARARNGDTVGSADSPYPISADADMRKWDGDSRTSV